MAYSNPEMAKRFIKQLATNSRNDSIIVSNTHSDWRYYNTDILSIRDNVIWFDATIHTHTTMTRINSVLSMFHVHASVRKSKCVVLDASGIVWYTTKNVAIDMSNGSIISGKISKCQDRIQINGKTYNGR